jgi:hypothetical protein
MTESQKLPIRMWNLKQLDNVNREYAGHSGYTGLLGNRFHWNNRLVNIGSIGIFLCPV